MQGHQPPYLIWLLSQRNSKGFEWPKKRFTVELRNSELQLLWSFNTSVMDELQPGVPDFCKSCEGNDGVIWAWWESVMVGKQFVSTWGAPCFVHVGCKHLCAVQQLFYENQAEFPNHHTEVINEHRIYRRYVWRTLPEVVSLGCWDFQVLDAHTRNTQKAALRDMRCCEYVEERCLTVLSCFSLCSGCCWERCAGGWQCPRPGWVHDGR